MKRLPSSSSVSSSKVRYVPIEWEGQMQAPPDIPEIPATVEIPIHAVSAAVMSGLNGMMREGVERYEDYRSGKLDDKQYTYRIVSKGSQAAVTSGARTVTALTLAEGAKRMITRRFGQVLVGRLIRYNVINAVAFGIIDQGTDTFKLYRGQMSSEQYKVKSVENAGGTSGAIGGAAAGALLGSVVPGIGIAAGMMLGMLGAMGGAAVGKSLGQQWFEAKKDPEKGPDGNTTEK
jgi:hypothetical protein